MEVNKRGLYIVLGIVLALTLAVASGLAFRTLLGAA